jgi:chromosome partitioning protein
MIVVLAGQKGGSGKTTTAICVADEWHRRGYETLLVDTDPQATARTWGDAAADADSEAPTVIGMGTDFHNKLPQVAEGYERVVVDCPPGHSERQRSGLMCADVVVIPCGPGLTDVWSMAETIDLANTAQQIRPSLKTAILITRKDARTVLADQVRQELDRADLPVLEAELGSRVAYQEMPAAGKGVTRYKPKSKAAEEVRALVDELESLYATEGQTDG